MVAVVRSSVILLNVDTAIPDTTDSPPGEIPEVDDDVKVELGFGELEGAEETHQLYPPIESRVIEANAELVWNHQKLLKDPYGEGWLLKLAMQDAERVEALMSAEEYQEFCAEDLGAKFAK